MDDFELTVPNMHYFGVKCVGHLCLLQNIFPVFQIDNNKMKLMYVSQKCLIQ